MSSSGSYCWLLLFPAIRSWLLHIRFQLSLILVGWEIWIHKIELLPVLKCRLQVIIELLLNLLLWLRIILILNRCIFICCFWILLFSGRFGGIIRLLGFNVLINLNFIGITWFLAACVLLITTSSLWANTKRWFTLFHLEQRRLFSNLLLIILLASFIIILPKYATHQISSKLWIGRTHFPLRLFANEIIHARHQFIALLFPFYIHITYLKYKKKWLMNLPVYCSSLLFLRYYPDSLLDISLLHSLTRLSARPARLFYCTSGINCCSSDVSFLFVGLPPTMKPPGFDPDINDPILPRFKCGDKLFSPNLLVSNFFICFYSLFFVPLLLIIESYLLSWFNGVPILSWGYGFEPF